MLSFRKRFQKPKRVSIAIPVTGPFDEDKFIELVVLKQERRTSWKQNRYISRQVRRNPKAARAWQDVKDTLPHERSGLGGYYTPLMKVMAVFLVAVLIAFSVYALFRHYNIDVSVHIERKHTYNLHFTDKRLAEVAAMIEDTYEKKVTFDREELSSKRLSGRMDTTRRVEDFLEDLRLNGVDNYIDDKGLIHIK